MEMAIKREGKCEREGEKKIGDDANAVVGNNIQNECWVVKGVMKGLQDNYSPVLNRFWE